MKGHKEKLVVFFGLTLENGQWFGTLKKGKMDLQLEMEGVLNNFRLTPNQTPTDCMKSKPTNKS